jgi:hypothetical protein
MIDLLHLWRIHDFARDGPPIGQSLKHVDQSEPCLYRRRQGPTRQRDVSGAFRVVQLENVSQIFGKTMQAVVRIDAGA